MPHVSGSDLEARATLTPDDAAALALSLVEAAICPGVPDVLTRKEREVTVSSWSPRMEQGKHSARISCTELGAWPITELISVSAGTEDVTIHAASSLFALYLRGFMSREALNIRFVTGYADGELPAPLKAAVVQLGSRLLEDDLDISRMSWDSGLSATYVGATDEVLPRSVRDLIAPWTFQGF